MPTLLDRTRPNQGGTITRGGVTRQYAPSATQNTDPYRAGSGGMITRGGMTRAYAPSLPRPPTPMRSIMPQNAPSPAAMDVLQGAPVAEPAVPTVRPAYTPGAYGAAIASRPPQQTERANPLTGTNNIPLPGTSVPVRSPFSQRGAISPAGQDADAMEAAMDEDVGTSMQGTFDRLRGTQPQARSLFAPRFRQPSQRQPSYMDRIFRATPEMAV